MNISKIRTTIADGCAGATRPLLWVTVFCLVMAWVISPFVGAWPFGREGSNHGPWRHFDLGRQLLLMAFVLPLVATVLAGIGFAVGGRSRKLDYGIFGIPISFVIVMTNLWLID